MTDKVKTKREEYLELLSDEFKKITESNRFRFSDRKLESLLRELHITWDEFIQIFSKIYSPEGKGSIEFWGGVFFASVIQADNTSNKMKRRAPVFDLPEMVSAIKGSENIPIKGAPITPEDVENWENALLGEEVNKKKKV